eukprot:CAMPEP_0184385108 /NCGR_PEP_ID=MMETSP0007-20130409/8514_1 /TAXON_ID=97485 /ORGANISM="Prymnesium parvum, Strain Texoma1" /LENGTH=34 /DNA_ID= /DNA_START= /DNA_END= /DNA_ORIENTATION=
MSFAHMSHCWSDAHPEGSTLQAAGPISTEELTAK